MNIILKFQYRGEARWNREGPRARGRPPTPDLRRTLHLLQQVLPGQDIIQKVVTWNGVELWKCGSGRKNSTTHLHQQLGSARAVANHNYSALQNLLLFTAISTTKLMQF